MSLGRGIGVFSVLPRDAQQLHGCVSVRLERACVRVCVCVRARVRAISRGAAQLCFLTNQAVLNPIVCGEPIGIEPTSPQTKTVALPSTPQVPYFFPSDGLALLRSGEMGDPCQDAAQDLLDSQPGGRRGALVKIDAEPSGPVARRCF